MAVNLVSLVMQFITPGLTAKMGDALGIQRDQAQKAVGVGIPAILAGLAQAAAKPQNQQTMSDAMTQQSTMLDHAKSAIKNGRPDVVAQSGNSLLASLLGGDKLDMLAGAVGRFAGIDPSTSKSLLGMMAPLVTGVIGLYQRSEGLSASALTSVLTSQSNQLTAAMPAGFTNLLSSTGLLDGIDNGWQSAKAAGAATAGRVQDMAQQMPPHIAAQAGQWSSAAKADAVPTGSHWPWVIAALAVLGGLAFYLLGHDDQQRIAQRPLAPAPQVKETTGTGVPDQRLTDLAADLTSSVSITRSTLQSISDPASAEAALPKLKQASEQLDTVREAMSMLPPTTRKSVSSVVTRSMPLLNQLFDRVLASPQIADVTKPTIDGLRSKLETLAKS